MLPCNVDISSSLKNLFRKSGCKKVGEQRERSKFDSTLMIHAQKKRHIAENTHVYLIYID